MKTKTLDGEILEKDPIPVNMGRCSWCNTLHPITELKKCKGFEVMPCKGYICDKCFKEYPGGLCRACDGEQRENANLKECDDCGAPFDVDELTECPDCGGMFCDDCIGWADDGCDKLCSDCRRHRRETHDAIEKEIETSQFSKEKY